jgi:hypothetical protein
MMVERSEIRGLHQLHLFSSLLFASRRDTGISLPPSSRVGWGPYRYVRTGRDTTGTYRYTYGLRSTFRTGTGRRMDARRRPANETKRSHQRASEGQTDIRWGLVCTRTFTRSLITTTPSLLPPLRDSVQDCSSSTWVCKSRARKQAKVEALERYISLL